MSNDNNAPQAANDTAPAEPDHFHAIVSIGTTADNELIWAANVDNSAMLKPGVPDMSNPAVFMAWWIQENMVALRNIAAREYNYRQEEAARSERTGLVLVNPQGGFIQ